MYPGTCEYRQTTVNAAFNKFAEALKTLKQAAEQDEPLTINANHTVNELLSAFDDQYYLPPQTVTDCTANILGINASIIEMKKTAHKNKKEKKNMVKDVCYMKEKLRLAAIKKVELKKFIIRQHKEIARLKGLRRS